MNLFRFFRPAASAPVARERLQILLEYERKLGSQIDLFAVLREEILAVVSRHVNVDPDKVQVTVDRGAQILDARRRYRDTQPGGQARANGAAWRRGRRSSAVEGRHERRLDPRIVERSHRALRRVLALRSRIIA